MFEAYFKARAKAERKAKFARAFKGKESMGDALNKWLDKGKKKKKAGQVKVLGTNARGK